MSWEKPFHVWPLGRKLFHIWAVSMVIALGLLATSLVVFLMIEMIGVIGEAL